MDIERKVGPKGQIVIPEEIRRIAGIKPRSYVLVSLEEGKIFIRPEKIKISELLEQYAKKHGGHIKNLDLDKLHEEEALERLKHLK